MMKKLSNFISTPVLFALGLTACSQSTPSAAPATTKNAPGADTKSATRAATKSTPNVAAAGNVDTAAIYAMTVTALDGSEVKLADYRGKAVLFVNTASQCGYTPQYEGLEKLHDKYGNAGLVVAGFPCNQFGGQEPGTAKEIRTFCTSKYGIRFPMFAKIEVNGPKRHGLYAALTKAADPSGAAGDVQWNFEKFLLHADGSTVQRFRSSVTPESDEMITAIETALPKG